MKGFSFWDITPCSPFKVNGRFGRTYRLHLHGRWISQSRNQRAGRWQAEPDPEPAFTLVSYMAFSALKMEATCSSETSVDFKQTRRRYIPEDRTAHSHRCENLWFSIILFSLRVHDSSDWCLTQLKTPAVSCSAGQDISRLCMDPRGSLQRFQKSTIGSYTGSIKPSPHTVHFNVYLCLRFPDGLFPWDFRTKLLYDFSRLLRAFNIDRKSYPLWLP
jgi:hypothetical protein